jgi:hypothetical protein
MRQFRRYAESTKHRRYRLNGNSEGETPIGRKAKGITARTGKHWIYFLLQYFSQLVSGDRTFEF